MITLKITSPTTNETLFEITLPKRFAAKLSLNFKLQNLDVQVSAA